MIAADGLRHQRRRICGPRNSVTAQASGFRNFGDDAFGTPDWARIGLFRILRDNYLGGFATDFQQFDVAPDMLVALFLGQIKAVEVFLSRPTSEQTCAINY